nr:MAG TPA: hypothetical protein [Caudoviricetes sp.]
MPKISELPLANKLKEEDYIPIVQDGVTKKVKGTHFVTEEEYSLDAFSPTIAANDKAMYKFGEGDTVDFSDSAYDGAYKSAILKGQTLVNINKRPLSNGMINNIYYPASECDISMLKTNTQYLVCVYNDGDSDTEFYLNGNVFKWKTISVKAHSLAKVIGTTKSEILNNIWLSNNMNQTTEQNIRVMLIEYQEGMENWDIPYFEGMQSVRMPVLCTVGKNLFDGEMERGNLNANDGDMIESPDNNIIRSKNFISVKGGMPIQLTFEKIEYNDKNGIVIVYYDRDKNFISGGNLNSIGTVTPDNCAFIKFRTRKSDSSEITEVELSNLGLVQLEYGKSLTSLEPHKSNILSTPSDLELGSAGDVRDTLDLLTGEIVVRTEEIILNGSESWAKANDLDNVYRFYLLHNSVSPSTTPNGKLICNNLPVIGLENVKNDLINIGNAWGINIQLTKDKLSSFDVNELKTWLSQNPVTVRYQLAEPVHKTVDLSGTPFGYKGGHIIKSSAEGSLLPKFEYEVAVSRGAQISQNTSTLIKHDEKITELLKKTAATYINQKAEIAYLLNMSNTLEEVQTIPFIEDDYVNDDCMVDSDMVMDDMEVEPEKEIIDNVDTLLINLIYDLIELNDTLGLSEKVELFRQSGLIDKHNYEIIKEKLNPSFKEEDYADINQ